MLQRWPAPSRAAPGSPTCRSPPCRGACRPSKAGAVHTPCAVPLEQCWTQWVIFDKVTLCWLKDTAHHLPLYFVAILWAVGFMNSAALLDSQPMCPHVTGVTMHTSRSPSVLFTLTGPQLCPMVLWSSPSYSISFTLQHTGSISVISSPRFLQPPRWSSWHFSTKKHPCPTLY